MLLAMPGVSSDSQGVWQMMSCAMKSPALLTMKPAVSRSDFISQEKGRKAVTGQEPRYLNSMVAEWEDCALPSHGYQLYLLKLWISGRRVCRQVYTQSDKIQKCRHRNILTCF